MSTSLQCSSSNAESVSTHAKHKSTASSKKRKNHLEPSVPLRAQFEQDFTAKRRHPHPSRTRANFSPQRNLRLPEKMQCFVPIRTVKSHPWFVKTKLWCEASFKFEELNMWKRSFRARLPSNTTLLTTPIHSTQLNLTLLCSTPFVQGFLQIRLYSTPIHSTQLNLTLLCSTLLNWT